MRRQRADADDRRSAARTDAAPALPLPVVAWLRSPAGREALHAMADVEAEPSPAVIERWRRRYTPEQVAAVLTQVALRRRARAKFDRADEMLFDEAGLEQASGLRIARHKARRFAGAGRVVDLCCGVGGDTIALAEAAEIVAVDRDPSRALLARHNTSVYVGEDHVLAVCADVVAGYPAGDAFHIDPARRRAGRRLHRVEQAEPSLDFLASLARDEPAVAIKLSPAVDYDAIQSLDAEVEIISEDGECKQAVAWCGRLRRALRRATVLPSGDEIAIRADADLAPPEIRTCAAGDVLIEPDAAVIRAHLVGVLARRHSLYGLDPRLAYLLATDPLASPFVTCFRVQEIGPWSLPTARERLRAHAIGPIEIKTRGFAADPEDLRRRLHPSGRTAGVLIVTRIAGKPTYMLCERC